MKVIKMEKKKEEEQKHLKDKVQLSANFQVRGLANWIYIGVIHQVQKSFYLAVESGWA